MKLLLLALALGACDASNAAQLRLRVHRTREHEVSCAEGAEEVSVIPWELPGCAEGQVCVASHSDGACPGGASCSYVGVGDGGEKVFGCVDDSVVRCKAPSSSDAGEQCEEDEDATALSVVGWETIGCVSGNPCVGSAKTGECPEEASCRAVGYDASGGDIYGCIANNSSVLMEVDSGGAFTAASGSSSSADGESESESGSSSSGTGSFSASQGSSDNATIAVTAW